VLEIVEGETVGSFGCRSILVVPLGADFNASGWSAWISPAG
jgi:hypothetical protein